MYVFNKIKESVSSFKFYWKHERKIRKSVKKVNVYMESFTKHLDSDLSSESNECNIIECSTIQAFQKCLNCADKKILLIEEAYKFWQYFVRAATERTNSQTINAFGDWNATFGYGENIVVLSTPYRGDNTIGAYIVQANSTEKNCIFSRIV